MEDQIHLSRHVDELCHIMFDEFIVRVARQVLDVPHVAGHEIIDAHHAIALGQQKVREVRPEKPGSSSDDGSFFLQAHGRWGQSGAECGAKPS